MQQDVNAARSYTPYLNNKNHPDKKQHHPDQNEEGNQATGAMDHGRTLSRDPHEARCCSCPDDE